MDTTLFLWVLLCNKREFFSTEIYWRVYKKIQVLCTTRRVRKLITRFCKPIDKVKDLLPDRLRTRIVYKFSCASCNACYVGETSRHFPANLGAQEK